MLKDAKTIQDCEDYLSRNIDDVNFIGEIELSSEDIQSLFTLVDKSFTSGVSNGLRFMKQKAPLSFAFYLSYKGIKGYNQGDYWSSIQESIPVHEPAIQTRVGMLFRKILVNHGLFMVDISDGYRYVTPILLHGGIPDSCIPNFMDHVVNPLVTQGLTDRNELMNYLNLVRNEYHHYRQAAEEASEQIQQYKKEQNELNILLEILEQRDILKPKLQVNALLIKLFSRNTASEYQEALQLRSKYESAIEKLSYLKNIKSDLKVCHQQMDSLAKSLFGMAWNPNIRAGSSKDVIQKIDLLFSDIENLIIKKDTLRHQLKTYKASRQWRYPKLRLYRTRNYHTLTERSMEQSLISLKQAIVQKKSEIACKKSPLPNLGNITVDELKNKRQQMLLLSEVSLKYFQLEKQETELKREIQELTHLSYEELLAECENVKAFIDKTSSMLKELGFYNVEEGFKEINKTYSLVEEMLKLEIEWKQSPHIYAQLDFELVTTNEIDSRKTHIISEVQLLENKLKNIENDGQTKRTIWLYADEPVIRFLMYGGEWAEGWLIDTVQLLANAYFSGELNITDTVNIPNRLQKGIQKWWDDRLITSTKLLNGISTQALPPQLILDTARAEIQLIIQAQLIMYSDIDFEELFTLLITSTPMQQVANIGSENTMDEDQCQKEILFRVPLRVYKGVDGKAEISMVTVTIEKLVPRFYIYLLAGNQIIETWSLQCLEDVKGISYMAFYEDGHKISSDLLPKAGIWIILPKSSRLYPENVIIEEDLILTDYQLLFIDLENVQAITLKDVNETTSTLSVSRTDTSEPYLSGGHRLSCALLNDYPVYTDTIPTLIIPYDQAFGLDGWQLVFLQGREEVKDSTYYLVKGLQKYNCSRSSGLFELPLEEALLAGALPSGWYTFFLRSPKNREYQLTFLACPELVVDFNPLVRFPSDKKSPIMVTLILPVNYQFEQQSPCEMLSVVDETYEFNVQSEESFVEGAISTQNEQLGTLQIKLPKIRWRIEGLYSLDMNNWTDQCIESWFGKWRNVSKLLLYVDIPIDEARYIEFYIDEIKLGSHEVDDKHEATLNLSSFLDLIGQRAGVRSIWIKLYGQKNKFLGQGCLLNVRTKWEVVDISWRYRDIDNEKLVEIQWSERGIAENRAIKFWDVVHPWKKAVTYSIAGCEKSVLIDPKQLNIRKGHYLMELTEMDLWGGVNSIFQESKTAVTPIAFHSGEAYFSNIYTDWEDSNTILISGNFKPCGKERTIYAALLSSYNQGRFLWNDKLQLQSDSIFDVCVNGISKDDCHFLLLYTESWTAYQLLLLPDIYSVSFPFNLEIYSILDMKNNIKIQPLMLDGTTAYAEFSTRVSRKIVNSYQQNEHNTLFTVSGKSLNLIWKDEGGTMLEIQKGVKCTSCGLLLQSQEEWGETHYPYCNSLIPVYSEKIPINLTLVWYMKDDIAMLQKKYTCYQNSPIVLIDNLSEPLNNTPKHPALPQEVIKNNAGQVIQRICTTLKHTK